MKVKTYKEMSRLETFEERFDYLKLNGSVGSDTFGFDRWLNQKFYRSKEWKRTRDQVIIRDNGCDLGIPGREIQGKIIIHHINPITVEDICDITEYLMNPDYLVCTSQNTHNAIHYGDVNLLPKDPVTRKPGDTKLW
jgi:hypothetical protein